MELGIGMVGTGYMARRHCEALAANDAVRLQMVCSTPRSAAIGSELAAQYGFRRAVVDYMDVLADPAVDVIYVCAPDPTHPDYVVGALQAGKHVFSEKPLARAEEDFERIAVALDAADRVLQVGMNCRYRTRYREVHRGVNEGTLGKLRFLRGTYVQNVVATIRERRKPWALSFPEGSFQLLHGGAIHCLDLLRWIGGDVESVFARGSGFELAEEWGLDTFSVSLAFGDGALGELLVSAAAYRPNDFSIEAWLDEGSILDGEIYRRRGDELADSSVSLSSEPGRADVAQQLDDLIEAVESGTQPMNSYGEAHANYRVLAAVERSLHTGNAVPIDRPVAASNH